MNSSFLRLAIMSLLCCWSPALLVSAPSYKDRLKAMAPVSSGQVIPVVDFFRPPNLIDPKINRAGTIIAALSSDSADSFNLITYVLASKKFTALTGETGDDVSHFYWLDDKRILFQMSQKKLYTQGLFSVEAPSLEKCITLNAHDAVSIVAIPRQDPLHPLVWVRFSARADWKDVGVVKVDSKHALQDGYLWNSTSQPRPKAQHVNGYFADRDGALAHCITETDGVGKLLALNAQGVWTPTLLDIDPFVIVGSGDTHDELIALVRAKEENAKEASALYRCNSGQLKVGELLYRDPNYDLDGALLERDVDTGEIVGLNYETKVPTSVWFDAEYKQIQAELDATFPNLKVGILNCSSGRKKFTIAVYSDTQPAKFLLYDREAHAINPIADTRPWIDPARMAAMNVISYKSRDGVQIEGYFSAPPAKPGVKWPLVVLPHGGPWVRDSWGWDSDVQFLVSRGYAVFQPNYRGSTGTTFRFPSDPVWQFRKMHEDVTDGVKAIIKSGLVDPKRIAIMGGSFGGYLAICGAAYEGDFYRCAISIAGVFDWEQILAESGHKKEISSQYDFLKRGLGDPKTNKQYFDEISPIRAAANIHIPIFIAHGDEDHVADVGESERLVKALKKQNVPLEVMFKYNEGHGFRHIENQVELYTRIEEFLAKYLAPEPAKYGKN